VELLGINEPVLTAAAIASLASLSFYVVYASGQFNVAQPGFMAVGAYAAALATTGGHSAVAGIAVGIGVSLLLAAALTLLTAGLSGIYLAMATLAFVVVVQQVIFLLPALNGALGIYGIPVSLDALQSWMILGVTAVVLHRLMSSRLGYEMRILREDAVTARGIGIDEIRVRLVSALVSATLAALAGSMQALTTNFISPSEYGFPLLILILSFAVVGGTDRYWGAIVGAVVLTLLPEYTRDLQQYREILSGVIILAVVILFPEGLAGGLLLLRDLTRSTTPRRGGAPFATATRGMLPERTVPHESVCTVEGVSKRFGGVRAVRDASLQLNQGRVYGLIGPNGAGKSTLVDLISGEQRADAGTIRLAGEDVTRLPAHRRARLGIARTFQTARLTQTLTAREIAYSGCLVADRPSILGYVAGLPGSRRAHRQARSRADVILSEIGLTAVASDYVRNVGWEEQRRLEVARAVALRPRVLLLDEPTAGMHAESLEAFTAMIRSIAANGVAVVLIEHNVSFILASTEVLYAMDSGSILAVGEPESVLRDPAVRDSYMGAKPS